MEKNQQLDADKHAVPDEMEINLLDILITVLKWKRMIFSVTLSVAFLTFIVLFFTSPTYLANSRVLPPQSSDSSSELLSQLAGVTGFMSGASGAQSTSTLYAQLLMSRSVLDGIINRFDLISVYKADQFLGSIRNFTRDDAREELLEVISTEADSTSGLVNVAVQDKDPKKAAEMANAFIDELKKLLQNLAVTDASRRRLFFESEMKKTLEQLTQSEVAMERFKETTGAISIDDQARAVMEGIANLEAQIAAKEIQIKVMKTYATAMNPDMKRAQEELEALRAARRKLEEKSAASGTGSKSTASTVIIPTGEIPSLGTEYLRLARELKYQQTLWEVIVRQYETARLDEAKDAPSIQVVDVALPPENTFKPKIFVLLVIMCTFAFVLSIVAAFILEYSERSALTPENRERISKMKGYLHKL